MLAGYLLFADRSRQELPVASDAQRWVLGIEAADQEQLAHVNEAVKSNGGAMQ